MTGLAPEEPGRATDESRYSDWAKTAVKERNATVTLNTAEAMDYSAFGIELCALYLGTSSALGAFGVSALVRG